MARRLYVNRDTRPEACVVVAGTARSGTTWLGDLLAAALRARVVFEPLNVDLVPEAVCFPAFPYRRLQEEDPVLERFCIAMLSGGLRGAWVDREVDRLFHRRRVVKMVRGNLMVPWLSRVFPRVPIVLLVRHPCAVVASRLALGWSARPDLNAILGQEALVADYLEPFRDLLTNLETEAERTAAVWCVHHLVPLHQYAPGTFLVVCYESMCLEPQEELGRIFSTIGGEAATLRKSHLSRPSMTSRTGSAVVTGQGRISSWQSILRKDEVDRVMGLVRLFGLDRLYDESLLPRFDPECPPPVVPTGTG